MNITFDNMTDAEISKRIALAIGYDTREIRDFQLAGSVQVRRRFEFATGYCWKTFDYRDPAVIWPIAERFDCFPWKPDGFRHWCCEINGYDYSYAKTAAKAVAIAVIASKKK